jgi:PERQ amino acid-rich with GYF domain-containing protein
VPQSGQGQAQSTASGPGPYVPPHHYQTNASRNGDIGQTRFTKEHLLNLYKAQKESGALGKNIADLFVGDWQPTFLGNGSGNTPNWNRKDDPGKEFVAAAVVCWDRNGGTTPLGLQEMTESEKEVWHVGLGTPPFFLNRVFGISKCDRSNFEPLSISQLLLTHPPNRLRKIQPTRTPAALGLV